MIKEKITVDYVIDREYHGTVPMQAEEGIEYRRLRSGRVFRIALDANTLYPEKSWEKGLDYRTKTFSTFKNNGKVSKTDSSEYDIVNREAERKLEERMQLKSETARDQKRAEELAEKINHTFEEKGLQEEEVEWNYLERGNYTNADCKDGWTTISVKTSHSRWYGNDVPNAPSTYYVQVPDEVADEAKELHAIRLKHHDDNTFDFPKTDYMKRTVREADHPNGYSEPTWKLTATPVKKKNATMRQNDEIEPE